MRRATECLRKLLSVPYRAEKGDQRRQVAPGSI
jgi:hypothetical protein